MRPIKFKECNLVLDIGQLPVFKVMDMSGTITACVQLSWRERLILLFTGKLWYQVVTFHRPLQNIILAVNKPI